MLLSLACLPLCFSYCFLLVTRLCLTQFRFKMGAVQVPSLRPFQSRLAPRSLGSIGFRERILLYLYRVILLCLPGPPTPGSQPRDCHRVCPSLLAAYRGSRSYWLVRKASVLANVYKATSIPASSHTLFCPRGCRGLFRS